MIDPPGPDMVHVGSRCVCVFWRQWALTHIVFVIPCQDFRSRVVWGVWDGLHNSETSGKALRVAMTMARRESDRCARARVCVCNNILGGGSRYGLVYGVHSTRSKELRRKIMSQMSKCKRNLIHALFFVDTF